MPAGRPSKYNKVITHKEGEGVLDLGQIEILSEYGLNNEQISNVLNIHRETLATFKNKNKKLFDALKKGKKIANANVVASRYRRAIGYYYEETSTDKDGNITVFTKYEHPNIPAGIYISNNRESDEWNNKQFIEQKNTMDFPKEIVFQTVATNGEEETSEN